VTFDGWLPWVSLQVSHDPTQGWLLWAAVAMVTGLALSLGVRRRRIWLRLTPSDAARDASPTVVSVGGLARSDAGNFATEFAALVERLRAAAAPSAAGESLELDDVGTVAAGKD
jgi:cytochrome c biogenesis protein